MMVRTLPIHANIDEEDTVSDYLEKNTQKHKGNSCKRLVSVYETCV